MLRTGWALCAAATSSVRCISGGGLKVGGRVRTVQWVVGSGGVLGLLCDLVGDAWVG